MDAKVVGFGPYKKELVTHFEYPPDWYVDLKDGVLIYSSIGHVMPTSQTSRDLADALGITIEGIPWQVTEETLKRGEHFSPMDSGADAEIEDNVKLCRILLKHGWKIFFAPEA